MSAAGVMQCAGAPRDLGWDQGRAARAAILEAAGAASQRHGRRLLGALARGEPAQRALWRDLRRHFPHLGERTIGLSRGAGLGMGSIVRLLAEQGGSPGVALAAAPERSGGGALLVRTLALAGSGAVRPWIRRGAPDNDFRSVEAILPWGVAALAGVNEHGLAATALCLPASPRDLARCAAPASLLVQECLQRFRSLEAAIEWCERRPAGGRAEILLADARGEVAGVRIAGVGRDVLRAQDGLLVAAAAEPASQVLAKDCAQEPRLDPARLGELAARATSARAVAVVVDPRLRSVAIQGPGEALDWQPVEA